MNAPTPTAASLLQKSWGDAPLTKDQKLQKWLDAKTALDAAKETEMEMRKAVVDAFPFDADKKEGTQNLELANGFKLKVVKAQNYNLKGDVDAALLAYENAAGTPEEHGRRKLETELLVKWKPNLSVSAYREAPTELLKAIETVLTITDGSPTLELVEPKAKK